MSEREGTVGERTVHEKHTMKNAKIKINLNKFSI